MAVRMRTTSVWVEHLTNELHLWCNRCMVSSGVRAWAIVHYTASDGASAMHLQQRLHCIQCGSGRHVVAADADHA